MAHQVSVREKVLKLRSEGYSYNYISQQTGLSKSTLSDWLSKIPYTPNPETLAVIGRALATSIAANAKIKQASFALAKEEAKKEIGKVSRRDLFMFGLGLYLGEGSKTNGLTRIVNSDPKVIKFAIAWLESIGLTKKNLGVRIHLYPDSNLEESTRFWMRQTGLPKSQFFKPQIDWRKDKKAYKLGKLPYGTAHLGVRSLGDKKHGVFLSRKILAWIDEMSVQLSRS